MRAPPAISVEVPPIAGWRLIQALLHGAAAATLAAWAAAHGDATGLVLPGAALAAAAGAAAGWWFSKIPPTWLAWTGGEWRLRVGDIVQNLAPGTAPQPMIDFNGFLLLRIGTRSGIDTDINTGAGPTRWLAVTRGTAGAAWHPLRAAVYSFASQQRFRSPVERPPF